MPLERGGRGLYLGVKSAVWVHFLALARKICYGVSMPEGVVKKRFVESPVGKVAGFVLALLWVASMCVVDAHAYSALPYAGGLCVVVVLALLGVLSGLKFVRIPMLAWVALGVGGYFLARSEHSYAVVESWRESALIVSCAQHCLQGHPISSPPCV